MAISFSSLLVVTSLIFGLGMFAVLTRSNIVAILMGIELMLNASALNVVGFSQFHGQPIDGQVAALFIIVLAASEAAIAFGILINFYRLHKSIEINAAEKMSQ